jgi:hypothetical protein
MHRNAWVLFAAALMLLAADANEELLSAARKGDVAAMKALLDKGASIEAKTAYGQTPLYLAAIGGHEEAVRFLLSNGAAANVSDTFYNAPVLVFVLQRKHYGVAKLLVAEGSGTADEDLAAVAPAGNAELVQAALEKGKPSQVLLDKTYEGALARNQADVAALLKKAGAREPEPAFAVDAKVLESYAGSYRSEQFPLDIRVSFKEGKLYLQAAGQSEFAPRATSATVFEFSPVGLVIEFDSPASFTFKQGSITAKYKKVVAQ